jgi:formylglycine-generating enzyme required for sulfatase activity
VIDQGGFVKGVLNLLVFFTAFFSTNLLAANGQFDVVTMSNGDTHNGTVAQERFNLKTPYGVVSVPYVRMASLRLGHGVAPDRLTTVGGDQFSGTLMDRELLMLRTLDPALSLQSDEIREIIFASRSHYPLKGTPDLVIAENGDIFAVSVLTSDFLVMGKSGVEIINRSAINYLDVAPQPDAKPSLIQVTKNSGKVSQGRLSTQTLRVSTGFNATLEIDFSQISAVALRVNHSGRHSGYLFRQRFNPHDLIIDSMRDGQNGPAMLALRGGMTTRGDIQGGGDGDEQPPKTVILKPFAIGIHEVTFQEYDLFCEATGRSKPNDQGWGRGLRPVVNVSWEDAVAYSEWLSQRTEKRYRLPTDAEWEYAARGGTDTRFWWGNELQPSLANCEGCGSLWDGEKSAPVGRFLPNPFGLHDTAGNVFEWAADCWNDSYAEAPEDGSALVTVGCGKRVIRGGAWSFPEHEIRSANRWRDFPTRSSDDTGFRVVRELN